MKEKELKKLSRLELLELLLEASTENQELKERIEKLTAEIDTARHIDQLSTSITQMEQALTTVNRIASKIKGSATSTDQTDSPDEPQIQLAALANYDPSLLDKEIYRRLVYVYTNNSELLSTLPLELQYAIKERAPSVLGHQES